MCVLLET